MDKKNEYLIQITSGRGPEECFRVVARVLEIILKEAHIEKLQAEVVESIPGYMNGTLLSALIRIKGPSVKTFISNWEGTIQWISQSPYRKYHKRKNWFVGVMAFDVANVMEWNERLVKFESFKASGPGGQHVNKTESAIRAKHLPSGITVVVSERKSQHLNKSEALIRLKEKVSKWNLEQATEKVTEQWIQHNLLERGNAVRVFESRL